MFIKTSRSKWILARKKVFTDIETAILGRSGGTICAGLPKCLEGHRCLGFGFGWNRYESAIGAKHVAERTRRISDLYYQNFLK